MRILHINERCLNVGRMVRYLVPICDTQARRRHGAVPLTRIRDVERPDVARRPGAMDS
jgi:hypothetical protein